MTTIGDTPERIALKAIDLKPPDKLQYICFKLVMVGEGGAVVTGLDFTGLRKNILLLI